MDAQEALKELDAIDAQVDHAREQGETNLAFMRGTYKLLALYIRHRLTHESTSRTRKSS